MRIIDADDLKEKLDDLEPYIDCDENLTTWILSDEVYNAVDNAPTVEPCYQTTSCLDCKNYDKENHNCPRYCEVIKEVLEETKKPQGKWIFHKDLNESCRYGCNQCGNLNNIPSSFCPNCGIRMKKGD